jgi:acyl-CoA synthetase (NDP forming)/nucleotide-binding universal stress UspA family protein/RimJ/RimL family protein N-acetyltransferase
MTDDAAPHDPPPDVPAFCVGVDSSQAAREALRWAADEADRANAALLLAHVGDESGGSAAGTELLADAAARVATDHPELQVHRELRSGDPLETLTRLSERACAIVLGRSDASGVARLLVGVAGRRLLAETRCPVVIVPADHDPRPRNVVLVGVSVSASGIAALRWAGDEARRRNAVLRGVRAGSGRADTDRQRRRAQTVLDSWLTQARTEFPDLVVRGEIATDPVTQSLVAAAATGAAVLVVGCRRPATGPRSGLGPIVMRTARHAQCATVIVPEGTYPLPHAEPPRLVAAHATAPGTGPSGTALRSDGRLVQLRPADADDADALRALDEQASDRSIHFRFFSLSRSVAERYTAEIVAAPQTVTRDSVVAVIDDDIVGLGTLEVTGPNTGELAVLIADSVQHEGIGTLLVEQLVLAGRRRGLRTLIADVLADNTPMIRVLRDLGLPSRRTLENGVVRLELDVEIGTDAPFALAVTERERLAETASLAPLLAPRSVAVIGVGSRENSVGRALLRNVLGSGYTGRVHVVHPRHDEVLGVSAVHSVAELPEACDLAIVAVPAPSVAEVVEQCGLRGVRSALLLSSGFGEAGPAGEAAQRRVLADARRHGLRLVGPNCLGLVNTDPAVLLNATFAPMPMLAGGLALASQSGAVGIAVMRAAADRGVGVAAFVSIGNKADVSGNDLLLAWEGDERVSVIGLYLESFGNPRKFVRVARTVARSKPVLALKAGRGVVGQRAGQSHTAAAAAAEPVVDALFAQAGVQRLDTMEQLLDAVRVIDQQPAPGGPRVGIVGNSGGPEILAADSAEAAGLQVVELSPPTRARIRDAVPTLAADRNPVDLGAAVQPEQLRRALDVLVGSGEVDAVVTVFAETLAAVPDEVRAVIASVATSASIPVIATEVGTPPRTVPLAGTGRALPVFGFPEPAVAALAVAVRAAAVTHRALEPARVPAGVDLDRVRAIVVARLAEGGGWCDPTVSADLLRACGLPMSEQLVVSGVDAACDAAEQLGFPVVVKRARGVHKSDTGGVVVDVRDRAGVRDAVLSVGAGEGAVEVLLQPMHTGGVEVIVGGLQDPQFGPVVMAGAGGVLTALTGRPSLRLAPLSDADVDAMLATPTMSRLLSGFRGKAAVSRPALADLVRRVGRLVDRVPEIAELDLNPVLCRGDELVIVDAKIRIAPATPVPDPMSRLLSAARTG